MDGCAELRALPDGISALSLLGGPEQAHISAATGSRVIVSSGVSEILVSDVPRAFLQGVMFLPERLSALCRLRKLRLTGSRLTAGCGFALGHQRALPATQSGPFRLSPNSPPGRHSGPLENPGPEPAWVRQPEAAVGGAGWDGLPAEPGLVLLLGPGSPGGGDHPPFRL